MPIQYKINDNGISLEMPLFYSSEPITGILDHLCRCRFPPPHSANASPHLQAKHSQHGKANADTQDANHSPPSSPLPHSITPSHIMPVSALLCPPQSRGLRFRPRKINTSYIFFHPFPLAFLTVFLYHIYIGSQDRSASLIISFLHIFARGKLCILPKVTNSYENSLNSRIFCDIM